MELKDKTVIVTGAGTGIGRALAMEFARSGAKVVGCGRRKDKLDETVSLIAAEGGRAMAVSTDITDPSQVAEMVAAARREFGAIDVLFNNAGSFRSIGGVHEVDPAVWWNDVTVNLYGCLLLIREVLPEMISRNVGVIVNMNGGRPVGGTGYACGKAGMMELTRVLAEELKILSSSVMVLSAGPGLVRTEMTELQANTEAGRQWIPSTKESFDTGNLRQPEDIARATMRMLAVATAASNGKSYRPDTDFSDWQ